MAPSGTTETADRYTHWDGTLRDNSGTPTTVIAAGQQPDPSHSNIPQQPQPPDNPSAPVPEGANRTEGQRPPENFATASNASHGGSRHGVDDVHLRSNSSIPAVTNNSSGGRQPDTQESTSNSTSNTNEDCCWEHEKSAQPAKTGQRPRAVRPHASHTASGNDQRGRRQ